MQTKGAEPRNDLEKANQDLEAAQAELQKRWQYLAEAQKLSHSGTFGWKVSTGELIWSDETYEILGFTRETNPTIDLVFDKAKRGGTRAHIVHLSSAGGLDRLRRARNDA